MMNIDSHSMREGGRHRDHHHPRSDRDRDDRRERDYDRRDRPRDDRRDRDRDRDRHRDRDRDAERDRERGSGRRRSRSPGGHHHHPRGSARRDYELDAYSSSRDYREREREDRYAGRDRRSGGGGSGGAGGEERGWERDRGPMPPSSSSRRDPRWEEDERASRRERDLFDDRGDRRRRERERDMMGGANAAPLGSGGRTRKRSASPGPPKRREPTPDLTNVASVLDRKRRLTQWDIKPPGYENVTAEQAKLSGMFPLPGAPRQQPMDPSRLQAFINQPAGSATSSALKPSNARQSKRLFVYNLPPASPESSISEFFNLQLNGLNVISSLDPCVSAQISKDRSYALLEFKTPEDTTVALALDGIQMEDTDNATNGEANGAPPGLSIQRPKDYIVPTTDEMDYQEGVVSNVVRDTANKLCISNIPSYITEEQVTELLVSFGELRAFVLVKDTGTEQSRGIAFCEYVEPSHADDAIQNFNGMALGDQHLRVQRASIGTQQASSLEMGVNAMSLLAGTTSAELEQGRVLQLLNMVTAEELMDNDEYEEICQDVKEECERYGKVLEIKVPRPSGGRQMPGVGKIFVKFEEPESAQAALKALAGRKFADRTVVVTYFGEEYFDVNAW